MASGECIHCGKKGLEKSTACSTGCSLAHRLPLGEEGLPVSWQLALVLAWGFANFNQFLFAGADLLMLGKGETEKAAAFAMVSIAVGSLVSAANLFLLIVAKPKRVSDALAVGGSLAIGGVIGQNTDLFSGESLVVGFCVANLLISLWLSRGLWISSKSKKSQKG